MASRPADSANADHAHFLHSRKTVARLNSPHTVWSVLTNLHSYSLWRQSKAGWQVLSVAESCCSHCSHRGKTAAIQTCHVSTAGQERQFAKHLDLATVLKPSINSLVDSRGVKRWDILRRKALHQGLY